MRERERERAKGRGREGLANAGLARRRASGREGIRHEKLDENEGEGATTNGMYVGGRENRGEEEKGRGKSTTTRRRDFATSEWMVR